MYENQRHELTGEVIALHILAKYVNGNMRTMRVNITYARGRDLDQHSESDKNDRELAGRPRTSLSCDSVEPSIGTRR